MILLACHPLSRPTLHPLEGYLDQAPLPEQTIFAMMSRCILLITVVVESLGSSMLHLRGHESLATHRWWVRTATELVPVMLLPAEPISVVFPRLLPPLAGVHRRLLESLSSRFVGCWTATSVFRGSPRPVMKSWIRCDYVSSISRQVSVKNLPLYSSMLPVRCSSSFLDPFLLLNIMRHSSSAFFEKSTVQQLQFA